MSSRARAFVLLGWLSAVTLAPAALALLEAARGEVLGSGLATLGALPAGVLGFLVLYPPQAFSLRAYLAQLRTALLASEPSGPVTR